MKPEFFGFCLPLSLLTGLLLGGAASVEAQIWTHAESRSLTAYSGSALSPITGPRALFSNPAALALMRLDELELGLAGEGKAEEGFHPLSRTNPYVLLGSRGTPANRYGLGYLRTADGDDWLSAGFALSPGGGYLAGYWAGLQGEAHGGPDRVVIDFHGGGLWLSEGPWRVAVGVRNILGSALETPVVSSQIDTSQIDTSQGGSSSLSSPSSRSSAGIYAEASAARTYSLALGVHGVPRGARWALWNRTRLGSYYDVQSADPLHERLHRFSLEAGQPGRQSWDAATRMAVDEAWELRGIYLAGELVLGMAVKHWRLGLVYQIEGIPIWRQDRVGEPKPIINSLSLRLGMRPASGGRPPQSRLEVDRTLVQPMERGEARLLHFHLEARDQSEGAAEGVASWALHIYDADTAGRPKNLVKAFTGHGLPPRVIRWQGRDSNQELLPSGFYAARLVVADSEGNKGLSPWRLLEIR